MIDDILGFSMCNEDVIELKSMVNAKMESKNLRLSNDKCYEIHVKKKSQKANSNCKTELKVHDAEMKTAKVAKYLGDIFNEEGNI